MPTFSIEPTGIRGRRANFSFDWPNDPHVHIKDYEVVEPRDFTFTAGDIITLSPTQNRYSFDYYEIWEPITVVNSSYSYRTVWGFVASFDPYTQVRVNYDGDITGSNAKIIARYR
jgi:hypothetical protein